MRRHGPLIQVLAQGQGLAGWIYKYIMVRRGVFSSGSDYARHPAVIPDAQQYREIDRILEELDLVGQ